jgi:hypothetical protein
MARERVKEGVEGAFIPPLTQNIAVKALRPETRILRPPKVSTQEKIPVNVLVQRCLS